MPVSNTSFVVIDFTVTSSGVPSWLPGADTKPAAPVVGMAAVPDGRGYWMVDAAGSVYAFGAAYRGSATGQGRPWR